MTEQAGATPVIRRLIRESEAAICAQMMSESEPWITLQRGYDASLKLISDPARDVFVATVNGEIVGMVVLVMRGAFVGYIQSICVAPAWRSRGIGRDLMEFAENYILVETPNVFICVSSFNMRAQEFYARLGYEVVGVLKDYLVAGYDEILLRKTTAPLSAFARK